MGFSTWMLRGFSTSMLRIWGGALLCITVASCFMNAGCGTLLPQNAGSQTPIAQPASPSASTDPDSPIGMDWMIVWVSGYSADPTELIPLPGLSMLTQGSRLAGNTSCNQLTGGYVIDVPAGRLRFTSLRNDSNLCQRANSDADDAIMDALIATEGFSRRGASLTLTSKGSDVIRLKAK